MRNSALASVSTLAIIFGVRQRRAFWLRHSLPEPTAAAFLQRALLGTFPSAARRLRGAAVATKREHRARASGEGWPPSSSPTWMRTRSDWARRARGPRSWRETRKRRKRITLEAEDDNNVGFTPAGPIQALTNGSAQVSVSDCLACSGCVTGPESVLLAEQAGPSSGSTCNEGRPVDVVIDRAALASVAQGSTRRPRKLWRDCARPALQRCPFDESWQQRTRKIYNCSRRCTSSSDGLRMRTPVYQQVARRHLPTVAVSATSTNRETNRVISYTVEPKTEAPLPLVTSQCPGTVCFLETAPHALPYLSSTKSPMAAAAYASYRCGHLLRRRVRRQELEGYRRDLMNGSPAPSYRSGIGPG